MGALDPRHVHEAGGASDQGSPWENQLRNGLVAALINSSRSIGHSAATLDFRPNGRMSLPALKFLEWREIRIVVIERDNEAERDLIVFLMIEESAAPCVRQRPALGVDYSPRLMFLGRNIP